MSLTLQFPRRQNKAENQNRCPASWQTLLGAQVALQQSPILPVSKAMHIIPIIWKVYAKEGYNNLPVGNFT